jgi:hypothetical protein
MALVVSGGKVGRTGMRILGHHVENWGAGGKVTHESWNKINPEILSVRLEPKIHKLCGVYWVFSLGFILVREHLMRDRQTLSEKFSALWRHE